MGAHQIDAAQEQEGQNRIEEANCGWEEGIFENSTVDKSLHSSEEVPEHQGLRPHQWENESGQGALRQGQVLVQRVSPQPCSCRRFGVVVQWSRWADPSGP